MTCAKGYQKNIPVKHIKFYEYFPCEDKESCRIEQYFEKAVDFIVTALAETNVCPFLTIGFSSLHRRSQPIGFNGPRLLD